MDSAWNYGGAPIVIPQKFVVIGVLFLVTLATGIWLGQLGRPLNPALSTLHKLLALAWVIFAAIRIYHAARMMECGIAFFVATAVLGLSTIALFATGALMMIPKVENSVWLLVHRIATVFAVGAFGFTLRLFVLNKH